MNNGRDFTRQTANLSTPRESYNDETTDTDFVLNKTVTVAKYFKATLWTWIALATLLVSCVFHIIAFAAPGWVLVWDIRGTTRKVGLWMTCSSVTGCDYHTVKELSDAVRATQTFAIFSFMGLLVSLFFTTAYIFFKKEPDPKFVMGAFISRTATALFLLITITVYGARWADGKYESDLYHGRLEYCFGFEVTCFVCELCGFILTGGEILNIMRQNE